VVRYPSMKKDIYRKEWVVMQHVKDEKDILIRMKKYISKIQQLGIDYTIINTILNELIPRDSKGDTLSRFDISTQRNIPFEYNSNERIVNVSIPDLKCHIISNVDALADSFGVEDKNKLCSYLCLFSLIAEIEKVYEHGMANGIIIAPCASVQAGYKELFNLFDTEAIERTSALGRAKNAYSAYLYRKDTFLHAINRNANLESAQLVRQLAQESQEQSIVDTFDSMSNYFASIGYHRNANGCFDHTFRDIAMRKSLKVLDKPNDLSITERVEYGLPVPETTRKLLLSKTHNDRK